MTASPGRVMGGKRERKGAWGREEERRDGVVREGTGGKEIQVREQREG